MSDVDDAVRAVRAELSGAQETVWFDAMCRADRESGGRWENFADVLVRHTSAAGLPAEPSRSFLSVVGATSAPLDVVAKVRDGAGGLARAAEPDGKATDTVAAPAADPRDLGWVDATMRDEFQAGLGSGWKAAVLATMDREWPVWATSDSTDRTTFLAQWKHVILPDPRDLGWVGAADRAELEAGLGSGWKQAVLATMDEAWPGWATSGPDQWSAFLTGWKGAILRERGTPSGPSVPEPASSVPEVAQETPPPAEADPPVLSAENFPLTARFAAAADEDAVYTLIGDLIGVDLQAVMKEIDAFVESK